MTERFTNIQFDEARLDSPLYAEGGEVEDRADDGQGLGVVRHLAQRRPELPAEGEQLPHLGDMVIL